MSRNTIMLYNGQRVDPFHMPKDRLPRIVFTHALSLISRYTGHSAYPYPVAAHSISLANAKEVQARGLQRAAALHDFSEALFNDMASPVKAQIPDYRAAETAAQRTIFEWWDEPWENMTALAEFDNRICVNEMAVLFSDPPCPWAEPLDCRISGDVHWMIHRDRFELLCDELDIAA